VLRRLAPLILVAALAACGGDDGGDAQRSSADGPNVGDHWHSAFGVYACGEFTAPENPNDPRGIHTHGDGLIHTHPFEDAAAGENATLGVFFEAVGIDLAALAELTGCDDPANEVRLIVDGREVETPPEELRLRENQVIVLALAPPDEEIPELPWADRIEKPGDV